MSSAPTILDDYLSRPKMAEQLGKSERTLERWESLRIGPPVTRIGRELFYNIESAREWLRSREQRMPRERRKAVA
jgi:hypothetical protein